MKIGLHDADAEHLHTAAKFPNYALMKISAWHKAQGDTVEWWNPMFNPDCDKVYSSKVFSFTPENLYLPSDTIRGGAGYDIAAKLPPEVDAMFPDYSIYPDCDYAIGFITRGCIRNCPWCVVPLKEGGLKPYRTIEQIRRADTDKVVLMDNNVLAARDVHEILDSLIVSGLKIDFNQGLDARLVCAGCADRLARLDWIKYVRFACDSAAMIEPLTASVRLLAERGITSGRIFVYFLVNDIADAMERVRKLRKLGGITLYAQAYRDFASGGKPVSREAACFAQKYIYSGQWRKQDWQDTPWGAKFASERSKNNGK